MGWWGVGIGRGEGSRKGVVGGYHVIGVEAKEEQ